MTADFPVVLDACVLVPASLRDTLLRCAERRMYLPCWSNEILDELRRTLLEKLGRSPEQVDHLLNELNRHFADARVEGFETLVARLSSLIAFCLVTTWPRRTPCRRAGFSSSAKRKTNRELSLRLQSRCRMRRFSSQLAAPKNGGCTNCKNNSVLAIRQTEFELSAKVLERHNIADFDIELFIQGELSL
jgi:hypothetical protein